MGNWKFLAKEKAFDAPYVNIEKWTLETPANKVVTPYIALVYDAVFVCAVTAENTFLVIKQFFVSDFNYQYTLIAGAVDKDLDLLDIVKAELKEEAGAFAEEIIPLGNIVARKWNTGRHHFFLAKNIKIDGVQDLSADEDISVGFVSVEEFKMMLRENKIHDSGAVTCAYKALDYLGL